MSGFSAGLERKSGEPGASYLVRTIPFPGRFVTRLPEQLQLHPTLMELGCSMLYEMNEAALQKSQSISEPILITTNGTILAGFGLWRLAALQGSQAVQCIEYPIGEEDPLHFILRYHQPRRTWNAYLRIRMALTLEPYFQQQALKNMRDGGKYKGLANLPNPYRIDVREEIAALAGVSPRLVGNVKMIQQAAQSCVLEALRNGTLKINGAMRLCKLPKVEQFEQFTRWQEDRAINQIVSRSIRRLAEEKASPDIAAVLEVLRRQEARQPGSVRVSECRSKRSIIFIVEGLDVGLHFQSELKSI